MYFVLNKMVINRKYFLLFIFSVFILQACSRGIPTPTPSPYPTQEPIRFNLPDLEPLLSGLTQLPARITSSDISSVPHPSLSKLPQPNYFISARYARGSSFGGRLSIFVYAYPEELDAAWPLVLDTIVTPREISGPGDLAAVNHSDLAFIRCNALVHIKLDGADSDELLTFAEKFDANLKPYVCPQE